MQCYTYQIGKIESIEGVEDITIINASVKSGHRWLAPTWGLLMAYKRKEITEEEYTQKFQELMRYRYRRYRNLFEARVKNVQNLSSNHLQARYPLNQNFTLINL